MTLPTSFFRRKRTFWWSERKLTGQERKAVAAIRIREEVTWIRAAGVCKHGGEIWFREHFWDTAMMVPRVLLMWQVREEGSKWRDNDFLNPKRTGQRTDVVPQYPTSILVTRNLRSFRILQDKMPVDSWKHSLVLHSESGLEKEVCDKAQELLRWPTKTVWGQQDWEEGHRKYQHLRNRQWENASDWIFKETYWREKSGWDSCCDMQRVALLIR